MLDEVRIMTTLGDGDCGAGRYLVNRIADRVAHARREHPDWQGRGEMYALDVIDGEMLELKHAVAAETRERMADEALDVIATCVRFLNREHDAPLEG